MEVIFNDNERFNEFYSTFHLKNSYTPNLSLNDIYLLKYYSAESSFEDLSFVVVEKQTVYAAFVGSAESQKTDDTIRLNGFGRPLTYFAQKDISPSLEKSLTKVIRKMLDDLFIRYSFNTVTFLDPMINGYLSCISKYLLDLGAKIIPHPIQLLELTPDTQTIKTNIRKSYKSLINWGKNNLSLEIIDQDNANYEEFDKIRQLHIEVSGYETRSKSTWDNQYEQICNGETFAITGKIDKEVVTASIFSNNYENCLYRVGVSKRELFDKPMSHALIWEAICYAKKIGCRTFNLGKQEFPNQGSKLPSEKELGISRFKRGFGGKTACWNLIELGNN